MKTELIAMEYVSEEAISGVYETRDISYTDGLPLIDPNFLRSPNRVSNMWQALENPAVWNGVALLSADVAKLPLNVRRRVSETSSDIDERHPAQQLIRWQANRGDELPWVPQAAFQFWQTMMVSYLIFNNAYAWIKRDGNGLPIGLYPLLPDATLIYQMPSQHPYYITTMGNDVVVLLPDEVLHLQSLRYRNGDVFTIRQASHSWGVGLSAERYTGKFFENGESGTGILTIPLGMQEETANRLLKGFREAHEGVHNAFKTIPLFDGVDYKRLGVNNRDSQLDDLRNLQTEDVARWLRLQPHKLGVGERQSYNSIEQENRDYLRSSLQEHLNVIAAECYLKLLTQPERDLRTHTVKHDTSELTQGDNQTQVDTGVKGVAGGLFTTNEWRAQRNMPPVDGGDMLRVPLNTGPAEEPNAPDEAANVDDENDQDEARQLAKVTYLEQIRPLFTRIRQEARRKSLKKFDEWALPHVTEAAEQIDERMSLLTQNGIGVADSMRSDRTIHAIRGILEASATETTANADLFADTLADKLRQYEEMIHAS